ncbi:MAG: tryptophan synthase subunit alpha [Planctomycetota bacterium]
MTLERLRSVLDQADRHASPFLVLGDPTPELSVELALAAVRAGASMLELGMPFSDPCADGPAIQAACGRAFRAGVSTSRAIEILGQIHAQSREVPKNLLVYGNLVHARGYGSFCGEVADAGASSLLSPDIPLEECGPLRAACAEAGLGHVQLVGPGTPARRLAEIDAVADAFLYLAAHQGITGGQAAEDRGRRELVERTVRAVSNPICLGFGLSQPHQLEQAFAAGARICVIGSHLARVIEQTYEVERRPGSEVVEQFVAKFGPLSQTARPGTDSED